MRGRRFGRGVGRGGAGGLRPIRKGKVAHPLPLLLLQEPLLGGLVVDHGGGAVRSRGARGSRGHIPPLRVPRSREIDLHLGHQHQPLRLGLHHLRREGREGTAELHGARGELGHPRRAVLVPRRREPRLGRGAIEVVIAIRRGAGSRRIVRRVPPLPASHPILAPRPASPSRKLLMARESKIRHTTQRGGGIQLLTMSA